MAVVKFMCLSENLDSFSENMPRRRIDVGYKTLRTKHVWLAFFLVKEVLWAGISVARPLSSLLVIAHERTVGWVLLPVSKD